MTLYGIFNNKRIRASPLIKGVTCEICKEILISKCGRIKIWHFAHKSQNDCDDWYEPESEWHMNWKNEFPMECQEVVIKKCDCITCKQYNKECTHNHSGSSCIFKKHRADIRINNLVIELQNSPISPENIFEREKFYENMIWILNGAELCSGLNLRKKNNIITFRWKHPPKSWWEAKKPIYIDLEKTHHILEGIPYLFKIKKVYQNIPCGGWGELISKENFIENVKKL